MVFAVGVSVSFLGVWRMLFVGRWRRMLFHPSLLCVRKIGKYERIGNRAMGRFSDIIIDMRRCKVGVTSVRISLRPIVILGL